MIPDEQPIVLINCHDHSLAIDAEPVNGGGLSLAIFDANFTTPTQLFIVRAQNVRAPDGNILESGIAFIAAASVAGDMPHSVAFQGCDRPLALEPHTASSPVRNAWNMVQSDRHTWTAVQITLPGDPSLCWSAGVSDQHAPIFLSRDQSMYSLWIVVLAGRNHPRFSIA